MNLVCFGGVNCIQTKANDSTIMVTCASVQCNLKLKVCMTVKSNSVTYHIFCCVLYFCSLYEFSILYFFRVSCMVACEEDIGASAIVCLGYPLKVFHSLISLYIFLICYLHALVKYNGALSKTM